jgi:hypothetical protein
MVRKTLSVGPDTWKALSSLGRFGMSFDDIIKILLLEHNELMRIQGKREIPLGPAIYKQSQEALDQAELQTQPYTEAQQQVMSAAGKPGKPVIVSDNLQTQLRIIDLNLPGIKFPASRSEIIKLAEEANSPDRVDYLEHIFNRKYKNKTDLNDELLRDTKNINVNVEFRINTEPLRKEQYKEKKLEQERQPIIK